MSTKGSPNGDGPKRGGNPTQSPSAKHICVYLAGNIGKREEHVRQAETLGRLMARKRHLAPLARDDSCCLHRATSYIRKPRF